MISRRDALVGLASAAALGCAAVDREERHKGSAPNATRGEPEGDSDGPDALDDALARLHETAPEFGGGLSNHGPMAAEALDAMGFQAQIAAFVDAYAARLEPRVAADPLGDWRTAIGKVAAAPAITTTLSRALAAGDVAAQLTSIVDALAPGLVAAAFHGPLRAAHAFRGYGRRPSDVRREELAHGLGYWAARHQTLPGEPGRHANAGTDALATIAGLPSVPASERGGGLILDRFVPLASLAGFAEAIEAFDPDARTPPQTLDQLALATARLYLGATSGRNRFVYLHGVTGTAAVRRLLPALPPASQSRLVAYHVQAIAAVHATHSEPNDALDREWARPARDRSQLSALAAASTDDHTIKFVEVCLSEFANSDHPEFLAAADHRVGPPT